MTYLAWIGGGSVIKDSQYITQVAKNAILDYQDKHRSAQSSLQVVADKVGASYSTIRNILQDKATISFKMAKNILLRLNPELTVADLAAVLDPQSSERLKTHHSHNLHSQLVDDKYEAYFQQERYFEILFRAFSDKGVERLQIKELFGQFGIARLEELLEVGLVVENEGVIKGNTENDINLSAQTNQMIAEYALKRYDSFNADKSWLSIHSQTYSRESYEQIREILRECFKKIAKIQPDEDGDYRAFISQLLIDIDQDNKVTKKEEGYYQ